MSGSGTGSGRRRALLAAIGVLVVVPLVGVIVYLSGEARSADSAGRPQPTSTPTPVAVASPAPITTGPHPSSCDKLYSPAMVAALGDLVLNPAWLKGADAGLRRGTDDPELGTLIDGSADKLTCVWGSAAGASGTGVSTNLVWVTPEQSAAAQARLVAAGMNCYEELGGMRCIVEGVNAGGTQGESHFLRDGIWLATRYVNAGPDGYTHDMVANIWAGA
ncbi:hypothetical protein E3T37_16445 [Cryobacterium sp. TMT2-10]|uniref:hypothetical protein n=1 Tax=unclassified Cryobacterium TaxID=2649013 RepID=UPI00106CC7FF|nr:MULTISPECIES: hypothetical protein [unclassified Cryobacterium]TFD17161.1 hypothetical protein E3T32_14220 [Cryobacterium sp. TMT2-23]TFD34750.1 hypothetical protein E3T37_16445 [Cryobacterium sp. TMT2-10]